MQKLPPNKHDQLIIEFCGPEFDIIETAQKLGLEPRQLAAFYGHAESRAELLNLVHFAELHAQMLAAKYRPWGLNQLYRQAVNEDDQYPSEQSRRAATDLVRTQMKVGEPAGRSAGASNAAIRAAVERDILAPLRDTPRDDVGDDRVEARGASSC